ncbi:SDO1-like protein [Escovopsis weberi]|uniref:SDO1-like protein n=1 Tax=Escovopsis weberi TaxID=150374 RepID=A0A0M9VVG0_ESCWE|nr:SDO1-like protein [Escovopsis weberi]
MTRGESTQSKVHYKGEHDDFLVFVDDVEVYNKWKRDSSIPLAHFVSTFQVFCTHKQGAQGTYDTASKSMLASEFGSEDEDEALKAVLRKGSMQNMEMPGRQGPRNESMSSMLAK